MPSLAGPATVVAPVSYSTLMSNGVANNVVRFSRPPTVLANPMMPAAGSPASMLGPAALRLGSLSGIAVGAVSAILAELIFPRSVADGTRTGHEAQLQRNILQAVKENQVRHNLPAQQLQQSLALIARAYPGQKLELMQGETKSGQVLAYRHADTLIPLMIGGQVIADPLRHLQSTQPSDFVPIQHPSALMPTPHSLRPPNSPGAGPTVSKPASKPSGAAAALAIMLAGLQRQLTQQGQKTLTLENVQNQCGVRDTAQSYLVNLGRDKFDQVGKAIPPKTYEWRTPPGVPSYHIKVQQGWGKDGLTYRVELTGPDNKQQAFLLSGVEVTKKGAKVPVAHIPLNLAGRSQGYADLSLRVGDSGLNEFEIKHTDPQGQIKILKLKPTPCDLDLGKSHLLRANLGNSSDARFWAESHLAGTARGQRGQLLPGLLDLLLHIQPAASGQYLNHGSTALAALTQPLNLLKAAGVDFSPLQKMQNRMEAKNWLFRELQTAVSEAKIPVQALVNPFGINYGIPSLAALMPEPARKTLPSAVDRNGGIVAQWVGAKAPDGRALQAPIISTSNGKGFYLEGKDTSYALHGNNLDQASASARSLIQSGGAKDLPKLLEHSPKHLRWVGAKTPDGMSAQGQLVYWRDETGLLNYGLKGKNRLYPLHSADGQPLSNTLEATKRAQDLIRHGAAAHLYALLDTPAGRTNTSSALPKPGSIDLLHTKVDIRSVQNVVHQHGWTVTQLPNGKFFLVDLGEPTGNLPQLLQAMANVLKVPAKSLQHSLQTLPLQGQNRKGYVVEARVKWPAS